MSEKSTADVSINNTPKHACARENLPTRFVIHIHTVQARGSARIGQTSLVCDSVCIHRGWTGNRIRDLGEFDPPERRKKSP